MWHFSGNCVCRRHWVALWYPSTQRTKPIQEGEPTCRTRKTQSQSLNQTVLWAFPASGHLKFWVDTWLRRKKENGREGKGKEVEKSYLFMKFFLKSHFLLHGFFNCPIWNQFLPPLGSTRQLTCPSSRTLYCLVLWSSISRAGSRSSVCFYFQEHLAQTLAKGEKEGKERERKKIFFRYPVGTKICTRQFPVHYFV